MHKQIPVHVRKGHPRFSEPLKILRQLGSCTYQLSDAKTCHVSHLSPACVPTDNVIENELVSLPLQSFPSLIVLPKNELTYCISLCSCKSSSRVKRPPHWLHDYVT